MNYPPGKAPLAILLMAIISGVLLLVFPARKVEGNMQLWTFADSHYRAFQSVIPDYEARHPGIKIDLQYVNMRAVTSRLRSAFAAPDIAGVPEDGLSSLFAPKPLPIPDLLESEISVAGTFFMGPLEDIGFVDISGELHKPRGDGPPWIERIVRSRFAPYTSRRVHPNGEVVDHIFGLPQDVHPVLLAYRKDIFDKYGVDAEKLDTWDKFLAAGRGILKQMNTGSEMDHFLLDLSESTFEHFEILLFQNEGGYFTRDGKLRVDDEVCAATMEWYVPLVAGKERVGATLGMKWELLEKSAQKDYLLAIMMPDWLSGYYEKYVPSLKGKIALMPLPAFVPGGRRTSTRGGTMMGFPKKGKQFEKAWALGLELYYDVPSRIEQFKQSNILPPLRAAWDHPAFKEPNPYWCNQPLGQKYAEQADNTPAQYSSPYVELAKSKIGESLCDCVAYYKKKGKEGFKAFVKARLKKAGDEIRMQMTLNPYQ